MGSGRGCFVFFLRFLKVLTILALLFNITAYVLNIKAGVESDLDGLQKTFVVLASTGYIAFDIILIISEFDPAPVMKFIMVFHYWAGRGLGMLWIGILTINASKQLAQSLGSDTISIIGTVAGWVLIGIGFLYIIMSLLCLRRFLGDKDSELETSLLRKEGGGDSAAVGVSNVEDAILVANLAIALGLSADDCRSQFSGKKGTKAAEKFVQQRAAAAARNVSDSAARRAEPMVQAANKVAEATPTYAPPSYSSPASQQQSQAGPPVAGGGGTISLNDDADSGRPGADDDELERMYYGGGK